MNCFCEFVCEKASNSQPQLTLRLNIVLVLYFTVTVLCFNVYCYIVVKNKLISGDLLYIWDFIGFCRNLVNAGRFYRRGPFLLPVPSYNGSDMAAST